MRAIRALEDGEDIPQLADDDQYAQEGQPEEDQEVDLDERRKRPRIGDGPQPDDDYPTSEAHPSGLLTAETMDGLKYFAQLRQARGGNAQLVPTNASKNATAGATSAKGLGGLGDYGSDEEDD